ncbi:24833_t:CDS:2, partial [Dentiscutata erythropus]
ITDPIRIIPDTLETIPIINVGVLGLSSLVGTGVETGVGPRLFMNLGLKVIESLFFHCKTPFLDLNRDLNLSFSYISFDLRKRQIR